MRKALAIAVVLGLAVSAAYASPMGPVKPTMGRFGVEFEVGAGSRDMELETANANKLEAENLMFLGRLSYGLTDKVELTVRLGAQDLDGDATPTVATYDGSSEFAWGVGISGILYDAGTWNVAGVANYFSSASHTGPWNQSGAITSGVEIDYSDWNIGLQIQGKYDQFLPYLGVKYSNAQADIEKAAGVAVTGNDYEAEDNVGVYVGAGFDLTPQWSGYVEGRFIDETSFGGGVRYTF